MEIRYPGGRFTEFYPGYPEGIGPFVAYTGVPNGWGVPHPPPMVWNQLQLLPPGDPGAFLEKLPQDESKPDNHYFEAREVPDAVLVKTVVGTNDVTKPAKEEIERFLFYRGMGTFNTHLDLQLNKKSELT